MTNGGGVMFGREEGFHYRKFPAEGFDCISFLCKMLLWSHSTPTT